MGCYLAPDRDIDAALQRLPQSSLKQRSKRAADVDTLTAAQNEIEFAMRGRLQMPNAVDVDNCRAMHAYETAWIEPSDEFAKGGAMDDALATYVQCHVDARTFDAVNRFNAKQIGLVALTDDDTIEKRFVLAAIVKQLEHALAKFAHLLIVQA